MSSVEEPSGGNNSFGGGLAATRPVAASSSRPNMSNSGRPPSDRVSQSTPNKKNRRSRTLSQPPAFHKHSSSVHSANYRPGASPEYRPTRIPKALRSPPLNPTRSPPMPLYSPAADLWEPPHHSNSSLSSLHTPSHKFSNGLLNEEQPPFKAGSFTSTGESFDTPRRSMESEETPFEHWYRGESSRNGGVGELRVGNKKEMMDIAQYGHSIRNKSRQNHGGYRDALTDAIHNDSPSKRRRADSVGPRGSFYLDEKSGSGPLVFDEAPLTDLELDDEGYGDDSDDPISRSPTPTIGLAIEPAPLVPSPPIAEPRTTSESARTVTEAPPNPAPPAKPKPAPAQSKPKRAVSPQTRPSPTSPVPKKVNGKTSPAMTPMRERQLQREKEREKQRAKEKELQNRRSIGQYNIDGAEGDMMHAIPSWTQPVQRSGNWDEVVLPVVAKKKGLDADGSYETADGTAKPKPQPPIEPAPGTFGFDHSRYQSQRGDEESIQMREIKPSIPSHQEQHAPQEPFPTPTPTPSAMQRKSQPPSIHSTTPARTPIPPPPSPAPFSHYAPPGNLVMEVQPPRSPRPPELDEEPASGGCCKCVIM